MRKFFIAGPVVIVLTLGLVGCRPAAPPIDPIAPQRAALNKAKALEGEMQQQLKDRMKSVDQGQ
jgi:hypothetical protein